MNSRNVSCYRHSTRSLRLRWLFPFLAMIAICSTAIADSPAKEKITFEPYPENQKLIEQIASGKPEDRMNAIQRLEKIDNMKVVPDLIYFMSKGQSFEKWMAVVGTLHILNIGETQTVNALLPYVGVEDDLFRKELEKLIVDLESGFREQHGFEHIYLRGYADQGRWPPLNAMEFLYRKGPGAALLTMTKAYLSGPETEKTRAIKWAEYSVRHVLALKRFQRGDKLPEATRDAVKALDELSKFEEWWVRLYVAEILSQHPEFRTEAMATRLSFDNDELVRRAISGRLAATREG